MKPIRRRDGTAVWTFLLAALLASHPSLSLAASIAVHTEAFVQTGASQGSWALGIVVPQGSALSGGRELDWAQATNITAVVTLPPANFTDNTMLVVLSAMVGSSTVVQVSAGLFPGSSTWRAVGWVIPDLDAVPQQYVWALNSSYPVITPGSSVALSIVRLDGAWEYGLRDMTTGQTVAGPFEQAPGGQLKRGDQETFAFESYTSNSTVLSSLGNLTMRSLLVDGQTVTGGTYLHGGWDPSHQPLFVVGGQPVPSSASLTKAADGSWVWGYSTRWRNIGYLLPSPLLVLLLAVLLGVPVACLLFAFRRKPQSAPPM